METQKNFSSIVLILVCVLTLRAAATPEPQPPQTLHPATQTFLQPIADPIQGFNRPVEAMNGFMVQYVVYPIGLAYNAVVPDCVKTGIANVAHNIVFPLRLVTNLLQGKGKAAWEETARFGINTTVGILGWNDQALKWGFQRHDEDFGQTLGYWGMGPGFYINLPFMGPSNLRDTLMLVPDLLLTPHTYLPGVGVFIQGNSLFANSAFLKNFFASHNSTYPTTRAAYTLAREYMVKDAQFPTVNSQPDDTLGILKVTPKNSFFYAKAKAGEITLPNAPKPLPYSLYEQDEPDGRIMFILPGLSSTKNNEDMVALAELFHRHGWTVAVISSTFTPEFFTATTTPLPGLLTNDCQNLDLALTKIRNRILKDIYKKNNHVIPKVGVFGVSLGAINTLYLAARDSQGKSLLKAGTFIAVNPPREPLAALRRLDQCYNLPQTWPPEQQLQKTRNAIQKVTGAILYKGSYPMPQIDFQESRFLIGLNCQLGLLEVIRAIADSPAAELLNGIIRTDTKEHLEMDAMNFSYEKYLEKILVPYAKQNSLAPQQCTLEQLGKLSSIDAIAKFLSPNPKIRLFHTQNDFLVTTQDIQWFQAILPQRCVIVPRGGHLGQLADPRIQEAILKAAQ